MSDQLIVERGGLEKKDKSELQAIVSALGGTSTTRARKAELIDKILELSGAAEATGEASNDEAPEDSASGDTGSGDTGSGETAPGDRADSAAADQSDASADSTGQLFDATESGARDDSAATESEASDDSARAESEATASDDAKGSGSDTAEAKRGASKDGQDSAGTGSVTTGGQEAKSGRGKDGGRGRGDKADDGSRASSGRSRSGGDSGGGREGRSGRNNGRGRSNGGSDTNHPVGPDGEPLADWEVEVMADGDQAGGGSSQGGKSKGRGGSGNSGQKGRNEGRQDDGRSEKGDESRDESDPNNRRGRRRGRGRGREDAGNEPVSAEPIPVAGALDLRDEGYGFLRVQGFLPSKEDVYVSVKQVRQYGLRKGDYLTGLARAANRNEKNPGFHLIESVNGRPPEEAKARPRFDDLTPLFPDDRLVMEMREEPLNMTTRVIDLVAPIGKGQRGLIVSPPKAGKTTIMKDVARAIETNNPEVELIVLLIDERPEEVTDMRRSLSEGEVAASTFDRPPEEHCAVAELTIERAKRMVEEGRDVCVIVDGITRLARAYNLAAPQTGKSMSGGLDAGAIYPAKRFFGAARNLEEGGSLTILATALVETGSKMDEVIFEEFKGTGNMELRLDRRLAEKRVYPAVDIDGSSTRREELLYEPKELKQAWKLRRVLSGMGEEGSAAGVEMLVDRLQSFKTNADFLAEIGKAPTS